MEEKNIVRKNLFSVISLALFVFIGNIAFAACPSADLTGDCFVDYEDFAEMAGQWLSVYDGNNLRMMATQWLTEGIPDPPPTMVYIPGGEFEMGDHFDPEGSDDELPVHAVLLDAFFMSRFEITNQQYCDYLNSAYPAQLKVVSGVVYASSDDPCDYPYCDTTTSSSYTRITWNGSSFGVVSDKEDHPVVVVSWYGSVAYCNWRSSEGGYEACYNLSTWDCDFSKKGYRLPTEAEYEYAGRGGLAGAKYPWGNESVDGSKANYWNSGDSYETGDYPWTTPVGYYDGSQIPAGSDMANGYGLYDMAGNVWEWCNDWYDWDYYDTSPFDNPTGPVSGSYRVLRGGGWGSSANNCRVANRSDDDPDFRDHGFGFRIVLDLE